MNKKPVAGRIFNPDPTLRLGAPSEFFGLRAKLLELQRINQELERELRALRRRIRALTPARRRPASGA